MAFAFIKTEKILLQYCSPRLPLLLALSGGSDSLYLFYALLSLRQKHDIPFHVAHVDHRWRNESRDEALILQQLALQFQVPFHLKVLNPSLLKGNLEAACREERYAFFSELAETIPFQALLTGHHQDDQAETVFKRLLEGAHWSRWGGIQHESWMNGLRVLRPLIDLKKSEILDTLNQKNILPFQDPSNKNVKFLRARLRETIFPYLNQEFGKQIQKNLVTLSHEAQELTDYFHDRLNPLLNEVIRGPFGLYLDVQQKLPKSFLEIKYLLRLLCHREGFFLSREIIDQAATALQLGKANQLFAMGIAGARRVWIDRQRIFIPTSSLSTEKVEPLSIAPGKGMLGDWSFNISEEVASSSREVTSWKEAWMGELKVVLPIGDYTLGFKTSFEDPVIKKRWNQAKVPAFLYYFFPMIEGKEIGGRELICHEFLTGRSLLPLKEGVGWRIELFYRGKNRSLTPP